MSYYTTDDQKWASLLQNTIKMKEFADEFLAKGSTNIGWLRTSVIPDADQYLQLKTPPALEKGRFRLHFLGPPPRARPPAGRDRCRRLFSVRGARRHSFADSRGRPTAPPPRGVHANGYTFIAIIIQTFQI
ncbi:hypothetical protein EVAR_71141_1 [Eumeta japonica]|uniref:Uncharacterized protein n=1 Tax=Eumeta variegata TaxID=151549 RepID=A0A4C2AAI1_EUMVA|nr:hypothetical protein EVAR_71141_1 [Eumeta japonica]